MPKNKKAKKILSSLLLVLALSVLPLWAVDKPGSISGVVQASSGTPAVGARVKVSNAEKGLTVSVISQTGGRYTVPGLPVGSYVVQAAGGGFQSKSDGAVQVTAGGTATKTLLLSQRQKFEEATTSSHLTPLMPEGKGKERIATLCLLCHQNGAHRIVARRLDQEGWDTMIQRMEDNFYGFAHGLTIGKEDRKVVLDYLTQYYGPDAPPLDTERALANTWVSGAAAKSVVTELDLPPGAHPHDVTVDSRGIGWVTESSHGVLGRVDPQTLTYTRIPVPYWAPPAVSESDDDSFHAITVDGQDNIWASLDYRNKRSAEAKMGVVRYNSRTEEFTFYPYPTSSGRKKPHPNTIRVDHNGIVWLSEHGAADVIFRLDPATKNIDQIPIPSAVRSKTKVFPYGMAIDGGGWIWFAEQNAGRLGRVDPKTFETTEYDLPTPDSHPKRMDADANGNVWFAEFGRGGKLGMVDYRTGKITEYPTPTEHAGTYSVTVDKKRNMIWVSQLMADQIARFDPRTKTFVEYPLPTFYSSVRRIEADPSRSNRVWYAGYVTSKVGYLDVLE